MKRNSLGLYASTTLKSVTYIALFCYFGFIVIPQWSPVPRPSPLDFHWYDSISPPLLVWLIALPIVLLALILIGFWGIVGLGSAETKKVSPNPKHNSFIRLSGISLLWFTSSLVLAAGTHFMYDHQKFDAEIWQNPQSAIYVPYDLTPRQRMVDDLTLNILPGSTLGEIEALLGPSVKGEWMSVALEPPDLIFPLGPDRRGTPFGEALQLWFDESGNFEQYKISTDG